MAVKARKFQDGDFEDVSRLIALFRVELSGFRGIAREPDTAAAAEELDYYLKKGFPVFVAEDDESAAAGYLICRVEDEVVWAESLYVLPFHRRKGAASLLYSEAEQLAQSLGSETVYNWVHPNNHTMIEFLGKKGYSVLNLIEIRKKREGEKLTQRINVGSHEFDY